MLQSSSDQQMVKIAKECRKHLRKGKKKSPINLSHQAYMLDAEYAAFKGKHKAAEKKYKLAIELAGDVIQEKALACERFSQYNVSRGNHTQAYESIREAHTLYSKWGKAWCTILPDITFATFMSHMSIVYFAIIGCYPKCAYLISKYPHLTEKND